jgi:hypothetical protein
MGEVPSDGSAARSHGSTVYEPSASDPRISADDTETSVQVSASRGDQRSLRHEEQDPRGK